MSKKSDEGEVQIKTGPYATIEILPVPRTRRTWGASSYAALWLNMSITVPTFMLGAAFTLAGIPPLVAIVALAIGAAAMAIISALSAHPGTAFGIPYGIITRAAFGIRGSQIPNILRALVATGWYGILLWLGGEALDALAILLYPPWQYVAYHVTWWFALFTITTVVAVAYFKPGKTNRFVETLNYLSTPMLLLGGVAWFALLLREVGQDGFILLNDSGITPWQTVLLALLASAAFFWSTAALNISDYSRFASSQKKQAAGQICGILAGFTVYGALGVLCSNLTFSAFGERLWIPTAINPGLGGFFSAFMLAAIVLGSLRTNIAANNIAINMAFVSLSPDNINWLRATVLSTIIAILLQPWLLIATWETYIIYWVVGYGILLGGILGILITDYYIIRKRRLAVEDLYRAKGAYWHHEGFGLSALLSLCLGSAIPLISLFLYGLNPLYALGPFASMGIAAPLYLLFSAMGHSRSQHEKV